MVRYCQGGSSRNTLLARNIISCGSGCSPGAEFSKNIRYLKKANNLLRSATVSFSKDTVFHGVNIS
jgi:hypothetical protein